MAQRLDSRFWASKRKIRFLNISEEVCPAYTPVVFSWDNEAGVDPPWNTDGDNTAGKPTILDGGRLAWPIGWGSMSETGYLNTLYAINGPFDVQPGGYGDCSIDYPLPLLIDPESFPIPEDEANPLGPQVPGTWQEYLEAWPGDIEGPPPCGFRSFIATEGGWQPASFMADFLLWTVLYWDVNPDGSIAKNRAIVMPFDGRAGAIPAGGSVSVAFAETMTPSVEAPISDPVTIAQQGQYQLNFYGTLEIDALGVPVNVALQITWGPAWDAVDFSNSPMAAASIVNGQLPVSGETVTLTGAGRMLPKFTVDTQVGITESGPYQDNDVVTVNTTVNYDAFGFETVSFQYLLYFLPGDTIQLIATNAGTEDSAVQINGGLTYQRTNNNPFGTIAVYY